MRDPSSRAHWTRLVFSTRDCTLLAPLPQPTQIRDCLCFPEHLQGARRVVGEQMIKAAADPARRRAELEAAKFFDVPRDYYDFPVYYISNRMSVSGPDVDVTWPTYSRYIDYELEWAAVIGKTGSQIGAATARDYIFGYSVFNDWSARDEQMKVMGVSLNLGPGQGKDFANGLGPCIVTADEIANPYDLTMTALCQRRAGLIRQYLRHALQVRRPDRVRHARACDSSRRALLLRHRRRRLLARNGQGPVARRRDRARSGAHRYTEESRPGSPHDARRGATGDMVGNMSNVMKR